MTAIHQLLKRYWGYDEFRPLQQEIIESILSGKDTLAILPTGGGKSICFQVPALAKEGICIVISPLIALMKDQVENLKKREIPALLIHSGMKRPDVIQTLKNATHDYFKFLYVSPERLETSLFNEYLPALNVNMIAVDEAHCISQWGYDFRPSYLRIAALRKEIPNVPVLALTASATEEVQKDIIEYLTPAPVRPDHPGGPLRQSRRGEPQGQHHYPKYKVHDRVQFEYARINRHQHTQAEAKLWSILRNSKMGVKFRRQHAIEGYIADFICLELGLIIEADGDYHQTEEQKQFDDERTFILESKGFKVVRFTNQEILDTPRAVVENIKTLLTHRDRKAPLSSSAGEARPDDAVGRGLGAGWSLFRQSFERKNLSYSVFKVDSKLAKLVDIVKKVSGTGIVYCKSRKRTSEIMQLLQMHGISSSNYHAGLVQDERNQRQKDWIDNKVRVMVCTNAFGMGIDKPDVRFVVHVDLPDCLENYYQEAGRAGRDGKKSYAVLLYDKRDIVELGELHHTRFPSFEKIKQVYGSLVNFLQVPAYSGEYQNFNFKFEDFIRNFNLKGHEALYVLKALEQDGWLNFNEQNFSPSTVVFSTNKEMLYDFEKTHPQHEPLLTTLLRSYGGIFDFPSFISEKLLAKLLRKTEEEIKEQLLKISSFGVIRYSPQNNEPQITFLKQRVPVNDLTINFEQYNKRKETFIARAQTMIAYAGEKQCRSQFINQYFGDKDAKPCGICDNCLDAMSKELSAVEFKKFSAIVFQSLQTKSKTSIELINEMKGLKKEKAWKVLEFLQAENKIEVDQEGLVKLK